MIGKRFKAGRAGQLTPDQIALAGQHKELVGPEALRRRWGSPGREESAHRPAILRCGPGEAARREAGRNRAVIKHVR